MTIIVTRPQPDNETTGASLRARGFDVLLAPMLRFEPVALLEGEDADADYAAIIVTSANALRAIEPQLPGHRWLKLPLLAVGDRTAAAARRAGFSKIISAEGDSQDLRELILAKARGKKREFGRGPLLYLAGADLSRDLAGELGAAGFEVVTQTAYRMLPVAHLPRDVCEGFAAQGIEAVLHYSRRSARAFLEAARDEGVEISALAIPQCCLSETVAGVLREAGATQVTVAAAPDENALFGAMERALGTRLA